MSEKIWTCKIGATVPAELPSGSDLPMRHAVEAEFKRLTGRHAAFTFSGWAGELTEVERAVVEDREPDPAKVTTDWPVEDGPFLCMPDMALRHARIAHALYVALTSDDPEGGPEGGPPDRDGTLDLWQRAMDETLPVEDFEFILQHGETAWHKKQDDEARADDGEAAS